MSGVDTVEIPCGDRESDMNELLSDLPELVLLLGAIGVMTLLASLVLFSRKR